MHTVVLRNCRKLQAQAHMQANTTAIKQQFSILGVGGRLLPPKFIDQMFSDRKSSFPIYRGDEKDTKYQVFDDGILLYHITV